MSLKKLLEGLNMCNCNNPHPENFSFSIQLSMKCILLIIANNCSGWTLKELFLHYMCVRSIAWKSYELFSWNFSCVLSNTR